MRGAKLALVGRLVRQQKVTRPRRQVPSPNGTDRRQGDRVRTYSAALDDSPLGHKQQRNARTLEGCYRLDWRNPRCGYYHSIHISYPDAGGEAAAKTRGFTGGIFVILASDLSWLAGRLFQMFDWTNGSIAVDNKAMADIGEMVPVDTLIEASR